MFQELDSVVLARDVDEHGLKQGDLGAVVHSYADGKTLEVEFVDGDGKTVALLTLPHSDLRPMRGREILHVREMAKSA